jgi:hypothetical protein
MTTYSNKDGDPSSTVDALVPESDNESTGNNLVRTDDQVLAKVDEGSGESESWVDTSSSVSCESLLGRESGRHFSKSQHDGEAAGSVSLKEESINGGGDVHNTHNDVRDE